MSERFEVTWNPEDRRAHAADPWWRRLIERVVGPAETPLDPWDEIMDSPEPWRSEIQPAMTTGDPALDLLVDRVMYATHGWGFARDDVALLVHEALWQIGHLVRQGARVEVPEIGTLQRRVEDGRGQIAYAPHPDLMECNDA